MEIVDVCNGVPCNAEVLTFLQENRKTLSQKSAKDKSQAKAATVVLEALNYLEKTPAGKLSKSLNQDKLNAFSDSLDKYNLTASERLQILNHCPRTAVEIQLLIEDSEERLTETQVEELLEIIRIQLLEEEESKDESIEESADA